MDFPISPVPPLKNSESVSTSVVSSAEAPSMLEAWRLQAQQEEDNDFRNLLSILRRRAWIVVCVSALGIAYTTSEALKQPEIYEGKFRVLVEPVNAEEDFSDLSSVLGDQQLSRGGSLDYSTQIQVLRSPELIEPLVEELNETYPKLTYSSLLSGLSISRVGQTKILQVSYTDSDPTKVQFILDELAQSYLKYSLDERQTNLRQGINFVEEQLPELQAQVNQVQNRLENFRQQNKLITPELQSNQVSSQLSSIATQRLLLDRERSAAAQQIEELQQPDSIATISNSPIYQQLLGELRSVETEIAEELTRFQPDSLAIKVLEEKRDNIVPLLEQEAARALNAEQTIAQSNLKVIQAQSRMLSNAEAQADSEVSILPSIIRQYTDIQRELEVATEALTRFKVTRESLEIKAAQTEIPWQLIEAPEKPKKPISPDIPRAILLGAVGSVIFGMLAAIALEKIDNVYHTIDELKSGTKLPLLGTLPVNHEIRDSNTLEKKGIFKLADQLLNNRRTQLIRQKTKIYGPSGSSEASFLEALRVLHTNIRMLSSDRPIRSILFSSALPGDGKSTVVANLAQVATAMGQRVLIVDTDLRKPQVHDRLHISNKLGLSNLISDDLPLKSVIQQVDPNSQLFALTAGKIPPDPTKLLASQKMQQLMSTFDRCFDLVIYDAPPTTGLADVSLIGRRTDGLVLVTRIGKTDKTVLQQTIETLQLAQISILGLVANGVQASAMSGYRYYAYGYEADDSQIDNDMDDESTTFTFAPISSASSSSANPSESSFDNNDEIAS